MKHGEGIIPLTQTEVMLVLATVILLLLVAKDASLNKATRQLKEVSGATTTTHSYPADPDAPVDDILVASSGAETDAPVLGGPDRAEENRDGSGGDNNNNRDPTQVPADKDLDTPDSPPVPSPDSVPHPDATAESPAPASTNETEPAPAPAPSEPGHERPGVWVGFDPCWRRHTDTGRRYYYAYDVTFERDSGGGRFLIAPHSDLQAGVPIIDDALTGDLKVLLDYPNQAMTHEEFRTFGGVVESALATKRRERTDDDYTDDCLLAVTLDGDAPGRVAEFVRVVVGLYPITR